MTKHEHLLQAMDIPLFGRQKCAFSCDSYQSDLLYRATKRTILNCSRQIGKSTIAALKAVHAAHHRPGITIVVTSHSITQSRELVRKMRNFAFLCGSSRRGRHNGVDFKNGARIIAIAANEDGVRGFSAVALLIVDEAARVNDEAYFSLLPTLAVSRGSLWLLSTPKGKRGFFYAEWHTPDLDGHKDADHWAKMKLTAHDCARIDPDFLGKQKRRLGERRFMQDYECYFLDSTQGMFHPDTVRNAFKDTIPVLDI